jgi:hypothetical protein
MTTMENEGIKTNEFTEEIPWLASYPDHDINVNNKESNNKQFEQDHLFLPSSQVFSLFDIASVWIDIDFTRSLFGFNFYNGKSAFFVCDEQHRRDLLDVLFFRLRSRLIVCSCCSCYN